MDPGSIIEVLIEVLFANKANIDTDYKSSENSHA